MYENPANGGFAIKQLQSVMQFVVAGGAAATQAAGTLTITTNPAVDGETVVIGGITYTFVAALTNVPNQVLIGATTTLSASNLAAAINAGAGAGTAYTAGTKAHQLVTASPSTNTVVVTAKAYGAVGNAITTTETMAAGAWGGSVLAGGGGDLTVTGITTKDGLESVTGYTTGVPTDYSAAAAISENGKIAISSATTGETLLVRWHAAATKLS